MNIVYAILNKIYKLRFSTLQWKMIGFKFLFKINFVYKKIEHSKILLLSYYVIAIKYFRQKIYWFIKQNILILADLGGRFFFLLLRVFFSFRCFIIVLVIFFFYFKVFPEVGAQLFLTLADSSLSLDEFNYLFDEQVRKEKMAKILYGETVEFNVLSRDEHLVVDILITNLRYLVYLYLIVFKIEPFYFGTYDELRLNKVIGKCDPTLIVRIAAHADKHYPQWRDGWIPASDFLINPEVQEWMDGGPSLDGHRFYGPLFGIAVFIVIVAIVVTVVPNLIAALNNTNNGGNAAQYGSPCPEHLRIDFDEELHTPEYNKARAETPSSLDEGSISRTSECELLYLSSNRDGSSQSLLTSEQQASDQNKQKNFWEVEEGIESRHSRSSSETSVTSENEGQEIDELITANDKQNIFESHMTDLEYRSLLNMQVTAPSARDHSLDHQYIDKNEQSNNKIDVLSNENNSKSEVYSDSLKNMLSKEDLHKLKTINVPLQNELMSGESYSERLSEDSQSSSLTASNKHALIREVTLKDSIEAQNVSDQCFAEHLTQEEELLLGNSFRLNIQNSSIKTKVFVPSRYSGVVSSSGDCTPSSSSEGSASSSSSSSFLLEGESYSSISSPIGSVSSKNNRVGVSANKVDNVSQQTQADQHLSKKLAKKWANADDTLQNEEMSDNSRLIDTRHISFNDNKILSADHVLSGRAADASSINLDAEISVDLSNREALSQIEIIHVARASQEGVCSQQQNIPQSQLNFNSSEDIQQSDAKIGSEKSVRTVYESWNNQQGFSKSSGSQQAENVIQLSDCESGRPLLSAQLDGSLRGNLIADWAKLKSELVQLQNQRLQSTKLLQAQPSQIELQQHQVEHYQQVVQLQPAEQPSQILSNPTEAVDSAQVEQAIRAAHHAQLLRSLEAIRKERFFGEQQNFSRGSEEDSWSDGWDDF